MQKVSVIVPTKNSAYYLPRCLASIKAQTYPDIELIVSDNYSDDDTVKIAKSFRARIVITPDSERSEQTNMGVKIAKGSCVMRSDSDVVLVPNLVEEAVKKIESGCDAVKVFGTNDETVGFWARVRKFEREMYQGDWMHSAPCFFRTEAFLAVGGFDEGVSMMEEFALQEKLMQAGFKIGSIGAKAVHLGEPESLAEIARKYLFYGRRLEVFLKQNPGKGSWQIAPFRLVFLRHWREFGTDVRLTFGFMLYHAVKYASSLIGYLSR